MTEAADIARAFWIVGPRQGEIRTEPLPAPRAGEVLVRVLASGISRGTESLVFRGGVPPGQAEAMRCPFQDGDFPWPVKYGYCSVGVVEAGPPALVGRRVFCLHPHQDRYVVPADAVHAVPDDVPDARAVLAANVETAVNGLWDSGAGIGDRILVIGAGVVGAAVARLAAAMAGAEVCLVDRNPGRAALAAALGVAFASPGDAPGEADVVVHASGDPEGLDLALRRAGFEATVLELSWYGKRPVTLPLGEAFHARRLVLRSSQVGAVAGSRRSRWSHARRLGLALQLLRDPVFDHLLSGRSAFDVLPSTMKALGESDALCHVVTYP